MYVKLIKYHSHSPLRPRLLSTGTARLQVPQLGHQRDRVGQRRGRVFRALPKPGHALLQLLQLQGFQCLGQLLPQFGGRQQGCQPEPGLATGSGLGRVRQRRRLQLSRPWQWTRSGGDLIIAFSLFLPLLFCTELPSLTHHPLLLLLSSVYVCVI